MLHSNRRIAAPLLALLAALLPPLTGCDQSSPTAPYAERPAFDFMNNPDNGNFRIARYEFGWTVSWTDPTNGLRATHSTRPLNDPDCGLQSQVDGYANQDVTAAFLHTNVMGDVWITIRDTRQPGACLNNRLVAEGWGRFHYTDNDALGTGTENANAWGRSASGELTAPDGSTVHYSGNSRLIFNDSPFFYKVLATSVNVH